MDSTNDSRIGVHLHYQALKQSFDILGNRSLAESKMRRSILLSCLQSKHDDESTAG